MSKINSIRRALLTALVLAAPAAWHAPLHAEEARTAQSPADPYEEMYDAIDAVLGSDEEFDRQFYMATDELRQLPLYQSLGQQNPQILDSIFAAMRPWMVKLSERVEQRYRPRYFGLMKQELSPDDARKLAAYFRTERGHRFLLTQLNREAAVESDGPRQPLGQPTAFLKPAEGYAPPRAAPAAPPRAAQEQDPAVTAILSDPELQARATNFFAAIDALQLELGGIETDKDIQEGMFRDMDYAASTYGFRLFKSQL